MRKVGAGFDLPIALGILAAGGVVPGRSLDDCLVVGELSLDGGIQPTRGVLPAMVAARRAGLHRVILPTANAAEAAIVPDAAIVAVDTLDHVVTALRDPAAVPPWTPGDPATASRGHVAARPGRRRRPAAWRAARSRSPPPAAITCCSPGRPAAARRCWRGACPACCPSSTSTRRSRSPPSTRWRACSPRAAGLIRSRPFRAPHHTISDAALVGGGSQPRPGEVTLAHHGVLFLDEMPEFTRRALEVLRQPLEEGAVSIARAARTAHFPARFQLVAAMNPCPCGFAGHPRRVCRCTPQAVQRYAARLSGPLRDRIDLSADLPAVPLAALTFGASGEATTAQVRARVAAARERQAERYRARGVGVRVNGALAGRDIRRHAALTPSARRLVTQAADRLGLSARAHDRVLRVARTIADLSESRRRDR